MNCLPIIALLIQQASILKILGLFAEHFPEHLVERAGHLIHLCMDSLGRQVSLSTQLARY